MTLAARIDSFHETLDGSAGRKLLEEVEKKFDKWQEPPPVKEAKALPRPDDAPRQKRGGKRVRKMKEKFAITEMRRQASRVTFGELSEDMYQEHIGFGVGSLAKESASGKVRNPNVDKKTQVSISKRLQVSILDFPFFLILYFLNWFIRISMLMEAGRARMIKLSKYDIQS